MGISRSVMKKSPSASPTEFYKLEAPGVGDGGSVSGASPSKVPDRLSGGPMRERIMGNPDLGREMSATRSTRRQRS